MEELSFEKAFLGLCLEKDLLSVEKDFFWTCTAMQDPLYAFEFRSRGREYTDFPMSRYECVTRGVTGDSLIKINILINIENGKFTANTGMSSYDPYYCQRCPDVEEFYKYAKKLVKKIL